MITLIAEKREVTGKAVRASRREGRLPAVVYGGKRESLPLFVTAKQFAKALEEAGETTLVELKVGNESINVLIHDVMRDAVTDVPLHADFLAVDMDKEVETAVLIEFEGESPAVKVEAGILVKVMHEVEISALPKNLPHGLSIDISKLEHIGDKLYVSDIRFTEGVTPKVSADEVVALVEAPRSEEELKAETETAAAAGPVEVETEQEAKRKAGEEAKAAAGEE